MCFYEHNHAEINKVQIVGFFSSHTIAYIIIQTYLPRTQGVIISYQNDNDLASKALALALTRAMLSLPYT